MPGVLITILLIAAAAFAVTQVGGVITLLLFGYLFFALLYPEKLQ